VREVTFQQELAEMFRAAECWIYKVPDQVISRMQAAQDGKMRFALPKPCDLIGCSRRGQFVAVEAKLVRSRVFRLDPRAVRQLQTLQQLQNEYGAFTALAVNFRFTSKRPPARVNRAFLILDLFQPSLQLGHAFTIPVEPSPVLPGPGWLECGRLKGGWALPAQVKL